MTEELEIEFKNLLTLDEYNKIYEYYNLSNLTTINNSNYYYDSQDELLKVHNAAFRIRHTDSKQEMTLKIKGDKANVEINVPLCDSIISEEIDISSLDISIANKLISFGIVDSVSLFQKIVTVRKELKLDSGLLVLDKNYYLNDIIDYELEFEVIDFEKGKNDFENILEKLNISKNPALPKIARAQKYLYEK